MPTSQDNPLAFMPRMRSNPIDRMSVPGALILLLGALLMSCSDSGGVDPDCVADCVARECGPDPVCGASCGVCGDGESCDVSGICIEDSCVPDCTGRACGPDPVCGSSCGACEDGERCDASGICIEDACVPDCTGRDCGPDPVCGESCGTCDDGESCDANGICIEDACVPDCTGRDCGPDPVCGASCGTCDDGEICNAANTCVLSEPLTPGMQWVRSNPMFISALTVQMDNPPTSFVNAYFNDFGATAAHLWQTGLPSEVVGWAAAGNPAFRWVTWVDANGNSSANSQFLGGLSALPQGLIGIQLWDEPMNWNEFVALRPAYDALRAAVPDTLLIMNFTSNDSVSDLDAMGEAWLGDWDGDIISYDRYSRSNRAYSHLSHFRQVGLDHRKPYWRYINSYYPLPGPVGPLTPSDLRWDAMSGAVYGYTGHTWFLYQIVPNDELAPAFFAVSGDFNAPVTTEWHAAAQVNRELDQLGRALVMLTSTDVRYLSAYTLLQPAATTPWSSGAGGDPYLTELSAAPGSPDSFALDLLLGFFVDDLGEIYLMVQNPRHTNGDWPNNNSNTATVRPEFDFADAPGSLDDEALLQLDQRTGLVVEQALVRVDATQRRLDVTIEAGDVFFFKYKTGHPFALQE